MDIFLESRQFYSGADYGIRSNFPIRIRRYNRTFTDSVPQNVNLEVKINNPNDCAFYLIPAINSFDIPNDSGYIGPRSKRDLNNITFRYKKADNSYLLAILIGLIGILVSFGFIWVELGIHEKYVYPLVAIQTGWILLVIAFNCENSTQTIYSDSVICYLISANGEPFSTKIVNDNINEVPWNVIDLKDK